jgi:hypothetical protein
VEPTLPTDWDPHHGAGRSSVPCATTDVRIRVPATGLDTYPDASVVCGSVERDPQDPMEPRALRVQAAQ